MARCPRCGADQDEGASACSNCGAELGQQETLQAVPLDRPSAAAGQSPVTWTLLAATGSLALAQSDREYAVYDQNNQYGRWPKTADGYRFASETYGAHAQSFAHGAAYVATGYQDPDRLGLPTEPVIKSKTYASPMSFTGSARRIGSWATKTGQRSPMYSALAWALAVIAILFTWAFVAVWYIIIFGIFGVFMFPYRLIRRSSRKSLHMQSTMLATQQAMLQQQAQQATTIQEPPYGTPGIAPPPAPPSAIGPPDAPPPQPPPPA